MTPQPSEQPDPREQVARWLRSRYGMLRNYSVPEMIMGLDIALSEAGVRLAPVGATAPDPVASPAPLDVERLAQAMKVLGLRDWDTDKGLGWTPEFLAADLAAAYEAVGQPAAEEPRAE